ncbi:hypothetical protein FQN55_002056 [Onygenales sp. PD_40]|nr:hypothetical protein FQN55_002056 [Onygenales sp. PD_40]
MADTEPPFPSSGALSKTISLESCPSIFVLPTHLDLDDLHDVEEALERCSAPLTYDITEAHLVLGKVSQKSRAAFELRSRGIWTEEETSTTSVTNAMMGSIGPPSKRRRVEGAKADIQPVKEPAVIDLSLESEDDNSVTSETQDLRKRVLKPPKVTASDLTNPTDDNGIIVINLSWLEESLKSGHAVPLGPYVVYRGRKISQPTIASLQPTSSTLTSGIATPQTPSRQVESPSRGIIERAKADSASSPISSHFSPSPGRPRRTKDGQHGPPTHKPRPKLFRENTEEHEAAEAPPPAPDWVRDNLIYACQRSAFLHPPNEAFIKQLSKIKKIRELTLDEIGVRAYSTSIAAIAAYPYKLQSAKEVQSLPGCESKIAILFSEFKQSTNDTLESATQLETDPVLSILNEFNKIWGVGAKTARDFYYHYHWRSIDDIIEHGWSTLSRVQQIGIKYFDEFQTAIPRPEVESIALIIHKHAKHIRPTANYDGKGIECCIVGGHRRGKEFSGDVDLILTHRDDKVTHNLIYDLVASLEEEGWITHTLALHLTSSQREQQTLPYRYEPPGGKQRFDTLDKALVVWQDPHFDANENDKNPNPHRRVDIIISPWRTVGCAIVGWTGDTTFERDLRRYAKKVHNWKFDSSGVRTRSTGGEVIDLEGAGETWEERERLVLEGMGVGWRPPEERCTR